MKLCDIKLNETAVIDSVLTDGNLQRRLMDLGFIKGIIVKKVLDSSHICAYSILGSVIALRNSDAKHIEVCL